MITEHPVRVPVAPASVQSTRILLYLVLSGLGFLLLQLEEIGYLGIQIGLTVLYLVGGAFEARVARHRFLLLPAAFFMTYSLINNMVAGIWYFATNQQAMAQFSVADASIVRGTWYTLVAVQVLWIGFHALPDRPLTFLGRPEIRNVPQGLVLTLVGISLASFVIAIRLNMYGYVADQMGVEYMTFLRFGVNLGIFAIMLLAIYGDKVWHRQLLHVLLVVYFVVGLLFGSKSTAVIPFVLLIVSLYAVNRKIAKGYLLAAVLGLVAAYAVVEPFRIYYDTTKAQMDAPRSVEDLAGLYLAAQEVSDQGIADYGEAFLQRMSYVVPLAKAMEFADFYSYYEVEEWGRLALSPLYGIIPRFLWGSKPLANFGAWASVEIFGLAETTSTGITPQGYAYLVARLPGVLLFFLLYGAIQRLLFNLLCLNRSFLPLFLLVYFDIGYPVSPWTFVAGTLQSLILMSPLFLAMTWIGRTRTPPWPQ